MPLVMADILGQQFLHNLVPLHFHNQAAGALVTLPFDKLLGLVYGVYGVLGGILVLFIIAKQFQNKDTAE